MTFFRKLFGGKKAREPEDVTMLAKKAGSLIDTVITDIFTTYHETLMREPITYIVFAVWGAKKNGEITPLQKEINGRVNPVVKEITSLLSVKGMSNEQEYAQAFLIRGFLISKMIYMIELGRTKLGHLNSARSESGDVSNNSTISSSDMFKNFMKQNDSPWYRRLDEENGEGDSSHKRW